MEPYDAHTVLDDSVGESLRGHHAHHARQVGRALGYDPEVATFVALPVQPRHGDWDDLARLLGPGGFADMFSSPALPPPSWAPVFTMPGLQMVGHMTAWDDHEPDLAVVQLGRRDVGDMLELARRTRPGPFWPRTVEMGTYLGIRELGRLIAMAGERLHPPGWTEISAVCSSPDVRGRGLATQVVRHLAARITDRGEQPFLHVGTDNAAAIALYRRLGFQVRRPVTFRGFRVPAS